MPLASSPVSTPEKFRQSGGPRRWGRWVLGLAVLVAILVAMALLLLDPWLQRTLEKQVAERTQGRYQLQVGALHTSLWHRAIRLDNIRLRPVKDPARWTDTTTLPHLLAQVGQLRISGIGMWAALRGKVVPIDSVVLAGVQLRLLQLPPAASAGQPLHQRLPDRLSAGVAIGYAALQHLQAAYGPNRRPQASLRQGDFAAQNILISAAGAADTQRLGYAQTVWLRVRGVALRNVAHHALALGQGQFSSREKRLTLDSVRIRSLRPQGRQEQQPKIDLRLAQLRLTRLEPSGIAHKTLRLDSLLVTAPHLTFTPPLQPPPALYTLLQPYLNTIAVAHARLTGGYVHVAGISAAPTVHAISVAGTAVRINKAAAFAPDRVFYARFWQLHTGPATARLNAPLYRTGFKSLDLDTKSGSLAVQQILLLPTMTATAINRLRHHQTPNITAQLPRLQVSGLNFVALDQQHALLAQRVEISHPHLLLEGDGGFPLNPAPSIVTPERLGTLPLRLNVRRLQLVDAAIRTNYLSPSSGRMGTLTFNRLNGTITNLTNDPRLMSKAHPAVAHASGYIANQWYTQVTVWLPLLDPNGAHWGEGTFGPASITLLNSMTEPSRNVRFASGNVKSASIHFQADRQQITGTMRAEYSDLKLTLLTKDGGADHKTLLTKVGSSLLNGIVVRNENPRHDDGKLKIGSMTSRREPRVSVFSLWRQGMVSGLLNSVGAPQKLAQKISEQQ